MSTRVDSASLIPGAVVCGHRGLGVLGSTVLLTASTGVLYAHVGAGDEGKEFRALVTPPASGRLAMAEDGTYQYTGPGESITYEVFADGVSRGTFTLTTAYTPGDETPPVLAGSIALIYKTNTAIGVEAPVATDVVGVIAYEWSKDGGATWVTGTRAKEFTGLAPSTSYTIQVRARDAAGNTSTPALGRTETTAATLDTTRPVLPDGLITLLSATATTIEVQATLATDDSGEVRYAWTNDFGATYVRVGRTHTFTGLTPDTSYNVQVYAVDLAGNVSNLALTRFFSTLEAGTPVAGALAATESGADTAAVVGATGGVAASGALAATEAGTDAAALAGAALAQGAVTASELGADTASIAAYAKAQGSVATTEAGQDTAALAGSAPPAGAGVLSAAEAGQDTAVLAGSSPAQGSAAAVEAGQDMASAAGAVRTAGALAATEVGTDAFGATGSAPIAGGGLLAAVESGQDAAALAGAAAARGVFSVTEAGQDTAALAGKIPVLAVLSAAEAGQDATSATGAALAQGALAAIDSADSFQAIGGETAAATGLLVAAEAGEDSASLFVSALVSAALAAIETGADEAHAAGYLPASSGALAGQESGTDSAAASGMALVAALLHAIEAGTDTAEIAGRIYAAGVLAGIEIGDDTMSARESAPLTDPRRTLVVEFEVRVLAAGEEARWIWVAAEPRQMAVSAEARKTMVPAEVRRIAVAAEQRGMPA